MIESRWQDREMYAYGLVYPDDFADAAGGGGHSPWSFLSRCCKLAYHVLRLLCSDFKAAQMQLFEHWVVILDHAKCDYDIGATDTLAAVFSGIYFLLVQCVFKADCFDIDNSILLERLTRRKLDEVPTNFIEQAQYKRERRYVDFLRRCCLCEGRPFAAFQDWLVEKLSRDLMVNSSGCFFLQCWLGGSADKEVLLHFGNKKWDDKLLKYHIATLELICTLCQRWTVNQRLLTFKPGVHGDKDEGWFLIPSHKQIISLCQKEGMGKIKTKERINTSYTLRATYVNVLTSMYIDGSGPRGSGSILPVRLSHEAYTKATESLLTDERGDIRGVGSGLLSTLSSARHGVEGNTASSLQDNSYSIIMSLEGLSLENQLDTLKPWSGGMDGYKAQYASAILDALISLAREGWLMGGTEDGLISEVLPRPIKLGQGGEVISSKHTNFSLQLAQTGLSRTGNTLNFGSLVDKLKGVLLPEALESVNTDPHSNVIGHAGLAGSSSPSFSRERGKDAIVFDVFRKSVEFWGVLSEQRYVTLRQAHVLILIDAFKE